MAAETDAPDAPPAALEPKNPGKGKPMREHAARRTEQSKRRERRPYIGDVGQPVEGARGKARVLASMCAFSCAAGFAAGLAMWALISLTCALTSLTWADFSALPSAGRNGAGAAWWTPLAFCTAGGLIIGLFSTYVGGDPTSFESVVASIRKTGSYRTPRHFVSVLATMLPVMFGGSVGPAAGLSGVIASGCAKLGDDLRGAGLRVKEAVDDPGSSTVAAAFGKPVERSGESARNGSGAEENPRSYDFRRGPKTIFYLSAAASAIVGALLARAVVSVPANIPRFDAITSSTDNLPWIVPCLLAGWTGALLYKGGSHGFRKLSSWIGDHPVLKPVLAGAALGAAALLVPYVPFPGKEQTLELMGSWESIGALALLATGAAKCLMTPLCLNFGWKGGYFLPLVLAGTALGYGVSALGGADPMLCVSIVTAALLSNVQGQPALVMALLLLCFPLQSIVQMGIACFIGAALPTPRALSREKAA